MKSPDEVAAAREGFLGEFERRVGCFAHGANLSPRYARELHDWLAEHHRERAHDVLPLLRDYPARVGQVEAMDACRRMLGQVQLAVEGERFPWCDVPAEHVAAWRRAFCHERIDGACPVCGRATLQRYFRWYRNDRGGGWVWCSTCFSFEHGSTVVPDWWPGSPVLDAVPMNVLEYSPEFLERALRLSSSG